MKHLTRDQILGANDLCSEEVDVSEWDGAVTVRTLTGSERDQLEASIISPGGGKDMKDLRAKLVALSVVDAEGERLFSIDDVISLSGKSASALDKIFAVAQRLSGFSSKDVKDLAGNSLPGQSEDSTSG